MVFQLVRRFSTNAQDTEDLAQEIFVKAYRALGGFKGQAKFSTWLYAIAFNHCRDHAKKLQRAARHHHESWEAKHERLVASDANPHQTLELVEGEVLLQKAICQLAPQYALPLLLRYHQGLPYRDIAELLDTTEGALKVRVHRARAELRKLLNGHYENGRP